jgi:REP element-mobilizing transposase RayT
MKPFLAMSDLPKRKPHRLSPELYQDDGRAFSITIASAPRLPVFVEGEFAQTCIRILSELRDLHGIPVYAYCLMPDHVHLLIGATAAMPVPRFIQEWKSRCYRERRRLGNPQGFWQRSYYDHALRDHENLRRIARYILENPVRAGLVDDFRSYPLSGSMEWDLK